MALRAICRLQRSLTNRLGARLGPLQALLPAADCVLDHHVCAHRHSEVTGRYSVPPSFLQAANYGAAARQLHHDFDTYKVSVTTGNVRGGGTGLAAYIQLIGSNGATEKVPVGNSEIEGLQRGSTETFDVQVPREIGKLRRLYIQREKSGSSDIGEGWYLDQVNVVGPDNEVTIFPCNSWFGHSDCGDFEGSLEKNLLPLLFDPHQHSGRHVVTGHDVKVTASGVAFPHPEKVIKNKIRGVNMKHFGYGGEDAYFYCHGKNGVFGMGVADGVYMWKELGIDSGTMSRTLMETAMHMVAQGLDDVVQVLQVAARHVESEGVQGSCTACLLTINMEAGRLHAATLGDSGFFLIGKEPGKEQAEIRFRTPQLEHEFGCPFQLGHHEYANRPEDAEFATVPVFKGDIIVMGSDGLLDNVSEVEIMELVLRLQAEGMRPGPMAQAVAKVAFDHSLDKHRVTPYSRAATEAFDMVYSGGKPDDITVLVALIE